MPCEPTESVTGGGIEERTHQAHEQFVLKPGQVRRYEVGERLVFDVVQRPVLVISLRVIDAA
jgi:hypothetical protein